MKIEKLIRLVTDLNNEKRTLFFNFSGHVNGFDIDIHKNGWNKDEPKTFSIRFQNNNKEIKKAYYEVLKNV